MLQVFIVSSLYALKGSALNGSIDYVPVKIIYRICHPLAVLCILVPSSFSRRDLDHGEEDDFIPFDQNIVSKYGPISRGMKTKLGNTAPLQVTANLVRSPSH